MSIWHIKINGNTFATWQNTLRKTFTEYEQEK